MFRAIEVQDEQTDQHFAQHNRAFLGKSDELLASQHAPPKARLNDLSDENRMSVVKTFLKRFLQLKFFSLAMV
eukprot:scaffold67411_cov18-Prasinocladus_malaysianus.AAC.1